MQTSLPLPRCSEGSGAWGRGWSLHHPGQGWRRPGQEQSRTTRQTWAAVPEGQGLAGWKLGLLLPRAHLVLSTAKSLAWVQTASCSQKEDEGVWTFNSLQWWSEGRKAGRPDGYTGVNPGISTAYFCVCPCENYFTSDALFLSNAKEGYLSWGF